VTPPIVGFIAPMQSGKTAICQALLDLPRHRHLHVMHFADPIKNCLRSIGVTKEGTPSLFRALAQTVGQTCRNHDSNHWVNRFAIAHDSITHDNSSVVVLIDDVRYQNEIDYILERGGTLVFVDAFGRVDLTEERRAHESELISNILYAELAEDHHTLPSVAERYSSYLNRNVWVVRNLDGRSDDAAYHLAQTLGL